MKEYEKLFAFVTSEEILGEVIKIDDKFVTVKNVDNNELKQFTHEQIEMVKLEK